jgi:putative transposase
MIVRRSVVVKLPKIDCDIVRLQALTNLAYRYRGLGICPEDMPRTACIMLYKRDFDLEFGTIPKKWFARQWLPMTVLRIWNGARRGDGTAPLVLDLDKGILKLRYICHAETQIPRWVYERVKEGGDIVFAMLGLKDGAPAIVLVAERDVMPYQPETIIVVDVNSWRHGIAVAYINTNKKIGFYTKSRPNLRLIDMLCKKAVRLWRLYGRLKRLGLHKTPKGKRIYRELEQTTSRVQRILRNHAQREAHNIVLRALKVKAKVIIDNALEESWRDLLEEGLSKREAKLYIAGVRRFIEILETQLRWYGVPYEFRRLPSTLCPNCEIKLETLPGRKMKCPSCGLEEDRDKIPILWMLKTIDTTMPSPQEPTNRSGRRKTSSRNAGRRSEKMREEIRKRRQAGLTRYINKEER